MILRFSEPVQRSYVLKLIHGHIRFLYYWERFKCSQNLDECDAMLTLCAFQSGSFAVEIKLLTSGRLILQLQEFINVREPRNHS